METIADRIADRLKTMEITERAASMRATGSPNTIRNIRIGDSKNPRADTLHKLAPVLGCTPEWLLTGQGDPLGGKSDTSPKPNTRPADVQMPYRQDMPRDIPVLGTAAGSATTRGAFQITTDVIDYVARPPGLAKARDVYALYVDGDSMEPRYNQGDLVFVSPHKPVRISDVIVIQEPNSNNGEPQAFIKILRRRTADSIITDQLNPHAEVKFINHPGTKLHKVLTMNELFGL